MNASAATVVAPVKSATPPVDVISPIVDFAEKHTVRDLHKAIPPECLERSVPRQLWGIVANLLGMTVSWWLLAINPFWWLLPPLWFLAGTTAWGLMVIAHECGHGSFSKNRRLNHFFGNLLMAPFLYPFHSWRLLHHHHHTNTNSIERDIDWRPMPVAVYLRLPTRQRITYRLIRTWAWWAGTLHQLFTQAIDLNHPVFAKDREKAYVKFSIGCVLAFSVVFFPLMIYYTGIWGVVKYWVMPWLVSYGWFSITTFMHHTHPKVPFLDRRKWSPVSSNICMTVYCRFPRWMEFFGHDINVHVPHHVAPALPYFHLRKAHVALKERFPDQVREIRFTFRDLWHRMSQCQLYDKKTGLYRTFKQANQRHQKRSRKTTKPVAAASEAATSI